MNASPKNQPVVGSARKNAKKGKRSPKGTGISRAARAEAIRMAEARKRAKNTPGSKGSKTMFNTLNNKSIAMVAEKLDDAWAARAARAARAEARKRPKNTPGSKGSNMFNALNNNIIAMVAERLDNALPFASTSKRTRDLREKAIKKKFNSIPGHDLSQIIHKMSEEDRFMCLSKYMHLLPLVIQLEFGDHTRASNSYIDNVVVPAMMPINVVGGAETEDMLRLRSKAALFLFLHILDSGKINIERRRSLLRILASRLGDPVISMRERVLQDMSYLPENLMNLIGENTIRKFEFPLHVYMKQGSHSHLRRVARNLLRKISTIPSPSPSPSPSSSPSSSP